MKVSLFLAFSLLAMVVQIQSDREWYVEHIAYSSLITEFNKKAKEIGSSVNWNDELSGVLLLPTRQILQVLKSTNHKWIDQLAVASVNESILNNPAYKKSKKSLNLQIRSINHKQQNIISKNMGLVMLGINEPPFEKIDGFSDAYEKLEIKGLEKNFLDNVMKELPIFKNKHDELQRRITDKLFGNFVLLRDDYMNRFNAINNRTSKEKKDSLSDELNEIKQAQEKFSAIISDLLEDLNEFSDETVRCAAFLLEAKNLKFNRDLTINREAFSELKGIYEQLYNESTDLQSIQSLI